MNKHLFIFKFWYVTDIPSDTIFTPIWKVLSLGFDACNVSVAMCPLPTRQFCSFGKRSIIFLKYNFQKQGRQFMDQTRNSQSQMTNTSIKSH